MESVSTKISNLNLNRKLSLKSSMMYAKTAVHKRKIAKISKLTHSNVSDCERQRASTDMKGK